MIPRRSPIRQEHRQTHWLAVAGLLFVLSALAVTSCHAPRPVVGLRGDARGVVPPTQEPVVRVRIAQGARTVSLSAPAGLVMRTGGRGAGASRLSGTLTITDSGRFMTLSGGGLKATLTATSVSVQAVDGGPVRLGAASYHGSVTVYLGGVGMDVINTVPLEQYLPGVLDRELIASWHPETFAAQAVAARSYAICKMWDRRGQAFDLEATTASQVYGGASAHDKAVQAVRQTRGQVLTYGGRVLPAYYSSASGGAGQDGSVAFPNQRDLPPLRGRNQGGWDVLSPQFRWGPIVRDREDLGQRLVAWGQTNQNAVANLRGVSQIIISRRSASGRPAQFTVVDNSGRRFLLGPEQFRFACNHPAPGLPALAKEQQLKSSYVTIEPVGGGFRFQGQGYGHGVGLSQWGAQNMALRGYGSRAILAFYYPGAKVVKAY